jgi:hypothetical protein
MSLFLSKEILKRNKQLDFLGRLSGLANAALKQGRGTVRQAVPIKNREKTIMKFKDMKIGDRFNYGWLGLVEVVAIHVFGTVDVVNAKGKYYRITGLA